MTIEELKDELSLINVTITDEIINQLNVYYNYLIEYNKHTNLTSITDYEEVIEKHFYDSISPAKIIDFTSINNLIDIGTGAGFPGVVIKIFYPHIELTLLDSNNKKTKFLSELVKKLDLKKVNIICDRSESYAKINREKYDLVIARAVKSLNILVELCLPLVSINGYFLAMKGILEEELNDNNGSIKLLGGEVSRIINFFLPIEKSVRNLILIKKITATPNKYPREYSQILKKPLKINDN